VNCAAFDREAKKHLENTFAENDLDNHAEPDKVIDAWGKTIKQTINEAEGGVPIKNI